MYKNKRLMNFTNQFLRLTIVYVSILCLYSCKTTKEEVSPFDDHSNDVSNSLTFAGINVNVFEGDLPINKNQTDSFYIQPFFLDNTNYSLEKIDTITLFNTNGYHESFGFIFFKYDSKDSFIVNNSSGIKEIYYKVKNSKFVLKTSPSSSLVQWPFNFHIYLTKEVPEGCYEIEMLAVNYNGTLSRKLRFFLKILSSKDNKPYYNKVFVLKSMKFYNGNNEEVIGSYYLGTIISNERKTCPIKANYIGDCVFVRDTFVLNKFNITIWEGKTYDLEIDLILEIPYYQTYPYTQPNIIIDPSLKTLHSFNNCVWNNDTLKLERLDYNRIGLTTLIPSIYGRGITIDQFYNIQYYTDSLIMYSKNIKSDLKTRFAFSSSSK
ncbi:MAG: hypothetical protein SFY32_10350 [Bacteroidota bacterium]|nr:hypothetical protein [Bacteroidota bacterium]